MKAGLSVVSTGRWVVDDVARVVWVEALGVSSGWAVFCACVVVEAIAIDALLLHMLDAFTYHVAAQYRAYVLGGFVSAPAVFASGRVGAHPA